MRADSGPLRLEGKVFWQTPDGGRMLCMSIETARMFYGHGDTNQFKPGRKA